MRLRGDGTGNLIAIPSRTSGLEIFGAQRGVALADFDEDGRVDLAVAQHAGPLHLFRNGSGRAGLRVRLIGPNGNRDGIGAQIRLRFGDRYGPMREVRAGAGYWSQDSRVTVLATPTAPSHLWVRWPGGQTTETLVPSGVRAVELDARGHLQLRR